MFSSYLHAFLVALAASVVAVSAAPGLIAKKSSPEVRVDGSLDIAKLYTGQQSQINTAAATAQSLAFNAYAYLLGVSSTTYWYGLWFGYYDASRKATVQKNFESISNGDFSTYTYDCSCTETNYYAYSYPSQPGKIWICPPFWGAASTGTNTKPGFFIYQASTWVGAGTQWNHHDALVLATKNPSEAVTNAANYEYFAENSPPM